MEQSKEVTEALKRKEALRVGEKIEGKPLPDDVKEQLDDDAAVFKGIRDARNRRNQN